MLELPDPDSYLDSVLGRAAPDRYEMSTDGPVAQWREWWRARSRAASRTAAGALAARRGFVLTTAQTMQLGFARHDVRREVRRGRWTVAGRGVVSPISVRDDEADDQTIARRRHALHSAAAMVQRREQVITARSAAVLHGLPTLAVPPVPELTTIDPATLGRRDRAHVYGARLYADDIGTWYGVPVSLPARTIVDLARHNRWDAIMAGDAALRAGLVTRDDFVQPLDDAVGWPGVRQARDVIALLDPLSESPLESVLRLAMHDSGFPTPELQVEFYDPELDRVYRVDLLLRKQRLIIEADGRAKYAGDALWREKQREGRLRAVSGNRVERVVWADMFRSWPATAQRLRSAWW